MQLLKINFIKYETTLNCYIRHSSAYYTSLLESTGICRGLPIDNCQSAAASNVWYTSFSWFTTLYFPRKIFTSLFSGTISCSWYLNDNNNIDKNNLVHAIRIEAGFNILVFAISSFRLHVFAFSTLRFRSI